MIRFILVQVPSVSCILFADLLATLRTVKARRVCQSGMSHMMTRKRCALLCLRRKRLSYECIGSQLRLRGEVHRVVAARDQKYQSNFVEVGGHRHCSLQPNADRLVTFSSEITRLYTVAMLASSSAYVLMRTTMN